MGAAWRVQGLDRWDFWFDESCSFIFVDNLYEWPESSNLLVESTNLPYYVLLHAWVSAFGDSEVVYRGLSALASILTIPLVALAGCFLGGRQTGLICGLLAAFNPIHVYYAQEARAYALWVLLLVFAALALINAVRSATRRGWMIYGAAMLCALHVHYFTIFVFPATFACIWLVHDRDRAFRQWVWTSLITGVLFVPYVMVAVLPAGAGGGSMWIAPSFDALTSIPETIWSFLPAGGYPKHLRGLSLVGRGAPTDQSPLVVAVSAALPGILMLGTGAILFLKWRRQSEGESARPLGDGGVHAFLAVLFFVPLLLALLYSLLIRPVYLVGRYDLVAWPALMLWAGVLLTDGGKIVAEYFSGASDQKSRENGVWILTGLMVACSLVPLSRMAMENAPATLHKRRSIRLAEVASEGAIAVAFSYDWEYMAYYAHRAGFAGDFIAFPTWLNDQIGWLDTQGDLVKLRSGQVGRDADAMATFLADQVSQGRQVIILLDSMEFLGNTDRAVINAQLVTRLGGRNLDAMLVDRENGIWVVQARPEEGPPEPDAENVESQGSGA